MLLRHSGVMAAFDSITVAGAASDSPYDTVQFTDFPFHPMADLALGNLKGSEPYQAPFIQSNELPADGAHYSGMTSSKNTDWS